MRLLTIIVVSCLVTAACAGPVYPWLKAPDPANSIEKRMAVPQGFQRVAVQPNSFGEWLRGLPLQPGCPPVLCYDGRRRYPDTLHAAVINMDVGRTDLQQCADTLIRLRAEYLFSRSRYADIHFLFSNGFRADFSIWAAGYRITVHGNRVRWVKTARASHSHATLRAYLDVVFTYAGTASLSRELVSVPTERMQIGDVFIHGGFPGHAEMIVDIARHPHTGETRFLLAQGFMPAQAAHIVKNFNPGASSPWYMLAFGHTLYTPEWAFARGELKRWR